MRWFRRRQDPLRDPLHGPWPEAAVLELKRLVDRGLLPKRSLGRP